MIQAKPLSEEECILANLPPKGTYPFRVLHTMEKNSPKVGDFFSMKMNLLLPGNKLRIIFDALFFRDDMMYKTNHFYKATGMMEQYNSGKFMAQDCDNAEGYCVIDHRKKRGSEELEAYVKDYVAPEVAVPTPAPEFDDDIPELV